MSLGGRLEEWDSSPVGGLDRAQSIFVSGGYLPRYTTSYQGHSQAASISPEHLHALPTPATTQWYTLSLLLEMSLGTMGVRQRLERTSLAQQSLSSLRFSFSLVLHSCPDVLLDRRRMINGAFRNSLPYSSLSLSSASALLHLALNHHWLSTQVHGCRQAHHSRLRSHHTTTSLHSVKVVGTVENPIISDQREGEAYHCNAISSPYTGSISPCPYLTPFCKLLGSCKIMLIHEPIRLGRFIVRC